MDFDEWKEHPYTKALEASIKNDYVPRTDISDAVAAEREACVKVCDAGAAILNEMGEREGASGAMSCAAALRIKI